MKKIMKYGVLLAVLSLIALTGCRKYDDPAPEKVYSDQEILSKFGATDFMTIADLKKVYYDKHGVATVGEKIDLTDAVFESAVIKGKIISTDKYGNLYRNMFIQDATGAIELKLGLRSTYVTFQEGQTLYVRLKGLVLGNYRYNLSLGSSAADDSEYANDYIDISSVVSKHFFEGERGEITSGDILVISSPTAITDDHIGRLIKFVGLKSAWVTHDDVVYPDIFVSNKVAVPAEYVNYGYVKLIKDWQDFYTGVTTVAPNKVVGATEDEKKIIRNTPVLWKPITVPTLAFKNPETGIALFGSSLFRWGAGASEAENLILRVSGYSNFANTPLVTDGKTVDITAILVKHSSKTGGFIKYQLLINSDEDIVATN